MNIYPSEIDHRIEPRTHLGDALAGDLNLEVHTVLFFAVFHLCWSQEHSTPAVRTTNRSVTFLKPYPALRTSLNPSGIQKELYSALFSLRDWP